MKIGQSNRTSSPVAAHIHDRRGWLQRLAFLGALGVAVALVVTGFALALPEAEEAHAAPPPTCGSAGYEHIGTGVPGFDLANPATVDSWQVISAPATVPTPRLAYPITPDPSWIAGNWFDPNNTSGSTPDPSGIYEYELQFYLSASTLTLNIDYAAADSVVFTLSDPSNNVIFTSPSGGSATLSHATYTAAASSVGVYRLHATVTQNGAGPAGLSVDGTVTCTPKPCASTILDVSTGTGPGAAGSGIGDGEWYLAYTEVPHLAYPITGDAPWASPLAVANWIDGNNTGGSASDPAGIYPYQMLPFWAVAGDTMALNINYAAADSVVFTLYGPVGTIALPPSFTSPANASGALIAATYNLPVITTGYYRLRATVTKNAPGPTGLLVEGTVTCNPTNIWGDNDCDGAVTGLDALWVLLTAANLTPAAASGCPTMTQTVNIVGYPPDDWGDVDCNPSGYLPDLIRILQFVGNSAPPPVAACPNVGQGVILY